MTIDEQVAERKKEAKLKYRYIRLVIEYFGINPIPKYELRLYEYYREMECDADGGLRNWGCNITKIIYKGKEVVVIDSGEVTTYIPGEWEAEYKKIDDQLDEKIEERRILRENREKAEAERKENERVAHLKAQFGL
jgi:hypothetical protein